MSKYPWNSKWIPTSTFILKNSVVAETYGFALTSNVLFCSVISMSSVYLFIIEELPGVEQHMPFNISNNSESRVLFIAIVYLTFKTGIKLLTIWDNAQYYRLYMVTYAMHMFLKLTS